MYNSRILIKGASNVFCIGSSISTDTPCDQHSYKNSQVGRESVLLHLTILYRKYEASGTRALAHCLQHRTASNTSPPETPHRLLNQKLSTKVSLLTNLNSASFVGSKVLSEFVTLKGRQNY